MRTTKQRCPERFRRRRFGVVVLPFVLALVLALGFQGGVGVADVVVVPSGSGYQVVPSPRTAATGPLLEVTLDGLPVVFYDFGQITRLEDRPTLEVVVTNIGDRTVEDPLAGVVGLPFGAGSTLCGGDGSSVCVTDVTTGTPQRPTFDGLAPGQSRTLRFTQFSEQSGEQETTVGFEGGIDTPELSLRAVVETFAIETGTGGAGQPAGAATGDFLDSEWDLYGSAGEVPRTAFWRHDFDSVNLFNGALALEIPLGPTLTAGGGLSLGVALRGTGNPWVTTRRRALQEGEPIDLSVVYPDPRSNAGAGWMLHLGRLFERIDVHEYRGLDRPAKERLPSISQTWTYQAPGGSVVRFADELHRRVDREGLDGEVLYSRDGGYQRLVEIVPHNKVRLDFPDGTSHVFEKRSSWGDSWFDDWRLTSMTDNLGNTVSVTYLGDSWKVDFGWPGRVLWIHFRPTLHAPTDPSQRLVEAVEYPSPTGVGNERHELLYTLEWSERPGDEIARPVQGVSFSRLTGVLAPDGSEVTFDHHRQSGQLLQLASLTTASGLRTEWDWGSWEFPQAGMCSSSSLQNYEVRGVVERREVAATSGQLLARQQYLQQLELALDVPAAHCPGTLPAATSITTVVDPVSVTTGPGGEHANGGGGDGSSVRRHYFSVWPLGSATDLDVAGATYSWGWHRHEVGLPFRRDRSATFLGVEGHLSEQLYNCGFESTDAVTLEVALATAELPDHSAGKICDLQSERFVGYELSQGILGCGSGGGAGPDPLCSASNRRLHHQATYLPQSVLRPNGTVDVKETLWMGTISGDFDGLGHYRWTRSSGNIAPGNNRVSWRTEYNPEAGTLTVDGAGNPSTIHVPGVSEPWFLEGYDFVSVHDSRDEEDPGDDQWLRQELCWQGPQLVRHRTLGGALGTTPVRTGDDLVTELHYDAQNQVIRVSSFGGDGAGLPTGQGWCDASLGSPVREVANTYSAGALTRQQVVGASDWLLHQVADAASGQIVRSFDATATLATDYSFDSMGRLLTADSTSGAEMRFQYLWQGSRGGPEQTVELLSDGGGVLAATTTHFDPRGLVARESERRPAGRWIHRDSTHNARGGVVTRSTWSEAASNLNVYRYDYDQLGRLRKVTDPADGVTRRSYGRRKITSRSMVAGVGGSEVESELSIELDRWSRPWRITEPCSGDAAAGACGPDGELLTTVVYDAHGEVERMRRGLQSPSIAQLLEGPSGRWQDRRQVRDRRGFLLSETLPESGTTSFSLYDARGLVGRILHADGRGLSFFHDASGRPTRIDNLAGRVLASWTYGSVGLANGKPTSAIRYHHFDPTNSGASLLTSSTWWVRESYGYGADGRVDSLATDVVWDGQSLSFDQGWSYDELGVVDRIDYPVCATGGDCAAARSVLHAFDVGFLDRLDSPQSPRMTTRLSYHNNGALARLDHGNGRSDLFGAGEDNMRRLGSLTLASGVGQLDLGQFAYDDVGNIRGIGSDAFAYDAHSRLRTASVRGESFDYAYDVYDNLLRINGVALGPIDTDTNRMLGHAGDVAYDAAGRLVAIGCHLRHYDELGTNLSQLQNVPGSECGTDRRNWLFLHSPSGRRVGTVEIDGNGGVETRRHRWTLRHLDGQVLREFEGDAAGLTRVRDSVWIGRKLVATESAGEVRHVHTDHLDSPRLFTDNSAWGQVLGSQHFEPFGTVQSGSAASAEEPTGFTGHETDVHERTTYMRARSYFPTWGRFLSPDPARSGWNLYAYVGNNPIGHVDPEGLMEEEAQNQANCGGDDNPCATFGEEITVTTFGEEITVTATPWSPPVIPWNPHRERGHGGDGGLGVGSDGCYSPELAAEQLLEAQRNGLVDFSAGIYERLHSPRLAMGPHRDQLSWPVDEFVLMTYPIRIAIPYYRGHPNKLSVFIGLTAGPNMTMRMGNESPIVDYLDRQYFERNRPAQFGNHVGGLFKGFGAHLGPTTSRTISGRAGALAASEACQPDHAPVEVPGQ